MNLGSLDAQLLAAGAALNENRIPEAEALLRERLKQKPTDVAAIRMLAEVAARIGRYGDAETLLVRCLELAPRFTAARYNYAIALHRLQKPAAALAEIDSLLAGEPDNPGYQNLKAAILARIGEYSESIDLYASVLARNPNHAKAWMSYGHALKTANRLPESIRAYRKSIAIQPAFGEAWWSLANLKTFRFDDGDLAAMRSQLARADLSDEDRLHVDFAVGKALEDRGEYAASFAHYQDGNARRRTMIHYDAGDTTRHVRRAIEIFTPEFLTARDGYGDPATAPIFVVGLPRSGSTLVEQILASHSLVEGTSELPDIAALAKGLGAGGPRYAESLTSLDAERCASLGASYLASTQIQRKCGTPFFIDKMPNNFAHIGLIHLILPKAKIIDARREGMACCFSAYKQHFAHGQNFTYSLDDVGYYYRDYVALLAHFDSVLPGRVHRVQYESMVADPEDEIRRLLQFCELPFEPGCVNFHENRRAVRTASSEQVRQPIYREALDHWKHYEPWLAPLKAALATRI